MTSILNTSENIQVDAKSVIINGERVFLHSAAIHYYRMPKAEWRDLLVKAKMAGINCIDTYIAWNVHEPQENEWDFDGDLDLGAFFDMCQELGMWVLVRPGPFICAEWDFGGLPWWLTQKEGIAYRQVNDTFLHYVDRYLDQIMPIIAKRQVTQGGSVLLVQVENEYGHIGSEEEGREYLLHLRDGMLDRGIDVPLITCVGGAEGTIEGANFWSGADHHYETLRAKQPHTPKWVTEFWTGWFEHWGSGAATQKTPALFEKRMVEVFRAGFSGLNHYMFFGGTNFGDWGGRTVGASDIFMITSYDYDAPLGEFGQTTEKYHVAKRLGYWLNVLGKTLMESDVSDEAVRVSSGAQARVRQWGEQQLVFVEHGSDERSTVHVTLADGRTLEATVNPEQVKPIVVDFPIRPQWTMTYNGWIGGCETIDGVQTLVVHDDRSQRSKLTLSSTEAIMVTDDYPIVVEQSEDGKQLTLECCHFPTPQVFHVQSNGDVLRIVVVDTETMNQTWWVPGADATQSTLLIGADDLFHDAEGNVRYTIRTEQRTVRAIGTVAGEGWTKHERTGWLEKTVRVTDDIQQATYAQKLEWETAADTVANPEARATSEHAETQTELPTDASAEDQPRGFSEHNQNGGYLWYTTEVHAERAKRSTIVIPHVEDTLRVYVNGKESALVRQVGTAAVDVELDAGTNRLAFLVQHMGRYNYSYALGEEKGISSPVYIDGTVIDVRPGWQWNGKAVHLDQVSDVEGDAILQRTFDASGHDRAILTGAIHRDVWVNGKQVPVGPYMNWYKHISIDISEYLVSGENTIDIRYLGAPLERFDLHLFHSEAKLSGWQTQTAVESATSWRPWDGHARAQRQPTWYRTTFARPVVPQTVDAKLALEMTGMGKGSIWLNGRNAGRFWQIGPQQDYKLPIDWLEDDNELLIFDEEGRSPQDVRLKWAICDGSFSLAE